MLNKSHEPSVKPWLLVAILLTLFTYGLVDRTIISMLVDPIRKELLISDFQVSLLLGLAFAAAYSIFGIPMGWLVDKFPRRIIIYLGVTFWSLAEIACGLSTGFWMLFISRMSVGLGESSLMPAAHSLLSDAFPKHRLATAISVYSLGSMVGLGLSLILGGVVVQTLSAHPTFNLPMIGSVAAWQFVFIVTGLPGLILAFAIFICAEPKRKKQLITPDIPQNKQLGMLAFLHKKWKLWLSFLMVFGVMNIVNGGFVYWLPTYMARYYQLEPVKIGIALGLTFAVAGGAGMIFSGLMVDRMFSRGVLDAHFRYFRRALLLSTPIVLFALCSSNIYIFLGFFWIAKFATVNFLGFSSAAVQITTPSGLRGRMAALYTTIIASLLGASLGPIIPATITQYVLHDETEIGKALAITLAICTPIALLGIRLGLGEMRKAVLEADATIKGPGTLIEDEFDNPVKVDPLKSTLEMIPKTT